MLDQRYSDNDQSKRDIPSFIEPLPPLISNPFMRPRPQKGTNLLELFEEDSESEEPELVQVYLRLKPYHAPSNLYEVRSDRCLITSVDTATAGHGRRTQHNVSKMYTFSQIFRPEATQKEVFESVVKENLKKLPDGHNFTLLTYGASGSGKTYTLMGTVASPGLVPRSLEYVFRLVDAAQNPLYKPADGGSDKLGHAEQDYELQWVKRLRNISAPLRDKYRRMSAGLCKDLTVSSVDLSNRTRHYVWVSFVEIYNEGIYDLLAPGDRKNAAKLRIREDATGNVYVKDVTQAFVRTGEEAYDVMVAGKHNLQVAATGVHAQSSRSHCIFTITMLTETDGGVRTSCVRLCDLAGCERARRTRNTGARMAESRAINSSLHVLERCLHTLRRRLHKPAPVPYRESKLTRLLGAGLSGARGESVSMVVTLNPAPEYAQETRHVLQLASVARDIQVNQTTIAESTLESSTQDTTISSSAEVMKLRSDNERLHFELVQAQARNKELLAAMEERQAEAAATMRELVDEAKDMTRQYYESQIQSLRSEMEDMVEEYECRLSKAALPPAPTGGSGTPSRALQNKVAQLMTEIAILEEKLTAEKLARARAEEEVQHLRACIEERDEANEETSANREDVMLLSDSEHDSDEEVDDPCNESLEPTFKKEDINKSRVAAQAFDQSSIRSDKSLDNSVRDNDRTINGDDGNNSVINKSEDTVQDHNNTETTDSVYATGEEDSASTNKTDICDSKNGSDVRVSIGDKSYKNETSANKYEDLEITDNFEKNISISIKKDLAPRGTYFIRTNEVIDDVNIDVSEFGEDVKTKKSDSLTRGTYFVKESNFDVPPSIQVVGDKSGKFHDEEPLCDSPMEENPKLKAKVSETLVSRIIKSIKSSHGSNTSLAQFEQLEMAANNANETKVESKLNNSFGNINILKEKRTYFEETASKELLQNKIEEVEELSVPKPIKEKKTYFDNIDVNLESAPNKKVTETVKENKLQVDDTRSPSIVKDEVLTDFTPSAIRKLLAESFSRQPEALSSVNKNKILHKKHDSVDLFEGLDSPVPGLKATENINVVEQARKSIEKLVLDQKSVTKVKQEFKIERETIHEEPFEISPIPVVEAPAVNKKPVEDTIKDVAEDTNPSQETVHIENKKAESQNEAVTVNNTIEEFENLCKDITSSRATEFDMLISQESNTTNTSEDKCEPHAQALEETKYNLRHKTHKTENVKFADKVEKEEYEEVLLESHAKCESKAKPTKRSLRLRRKKNQSEEDVLEQENGKLKDIVNLQKEFSDVTLDVPAPVKEFKDIESPDKVKCEDENVPPLMGVQSCPSKSVTRSRRKLFTPRAEPLDESGGAGDSNERLYVPRPSYHRARARRKL